MAGRLIAVLGGARSGKSAWAESRARSLGEDRVLYVATATPGDDEMLERIRIHRARRPRAWRTLEAPLGVGAAARAAAGDAVVVVVDCLTLLATNGMLAQGDSPPEQAEGAVLAELESLIQASRASAATWIVVSNEVGLGIVPVSTLGRVFRDVLGRANQRLAAEADEVVLLVAGLPMRLK